MIGALLRNPRLLICVLLGAAAIGGGVWYSSIPDVVPPAAPNSPAAASNQSTAPDPSAPSVTPSVGSREQDAAIAARLFEIADSSGVKAAFEQLEAEYATGNVGRARIWFALKCLLRDPKYLVDVLAQLKNPNERREVLFAGASRMVSRNMVKPEVFDQLGLSQSEQQGVQNSIVSALTDDRRFSEALRVLDNMEPSDQRKGAFLNFVEGYARADAPNAVSMAKNLQGEDRREARAMLKTVFQEKGYTDGLRHMLQDSQDDTEKQLLVSSIVKAYGTYRDNVGASQFVDSLDTSLQGVGRKALSETFR